MTTRVLDKNVSPELCKRTKEVIEQTQEALDRLLQEASTAHLQKVLRDLSALQEVTRTRRTVVVGAYLLAAQQLKAKYGMMRSEERLGRIITEALEYLEQESKAILKSVAGRDERTLRTTIAGMCRLAKQQLKQGESQGYAPLLE